LHNISPATIPCLDANDDERTEKTDVTERLVFKSTPISFEVDKQNDGAHTCHCPIRVEFECVDMGDEE
jgi:hypothetical protein